DEPDRQEGRRRNRLHRAQTCRPGYHAPRARGYHAPRTTHATMTDPRRQLPSVDSLLAGPGVAPLLATHPRPLVVKAARAAVDEARVNGGTAPAEGWDEAVSAAVRGGGVAS